MQKDYGLAGNLYWETVFWTRYRDEVREKTDVYEGDPMHFPGDNGDGYLVYPGDVYGIDGPVGSIRLESIRDGLEEYEMLADLENAMRRRGWTIPTCCRRFTADCMRAPGLRRPRGNLCG